MLYSQVGDLRYSAYLCMKQCAPEKGSVVLHGHERTWGTQMPFSESEDKGTAACVRQTVVERLQTTHILNISVKQ